MPYISSVSKTLLGQPMFSIIDAARSLETQGYDVVHLEIGDPDFNTPEHIKSAGMEAIAKNMTHYVSSWGIPELRLAVQEATLLSRGFEPSMKQVLITPGANISIFYAILATTDPGFEVLYPDPGFPSYLSTILATGAVGKPYALKAESKFKVRLEDIEPFVSPKTKLIIINSPQNPTGSVSDEIELRKIFDFAREKDLWIFSDEIYARMNYGETRHFSVSTLDKAAERVILSNGFSKAFAMTGWRIGTVIAPEEVAEKMMLLLQTTSSCVSPFTQYAALQALNGPQSDIHAMMQTYKRRRELLVDGLNRIPGLSCHLPGGAFYAFPDISGFGIPSLEFSNRLLQEAHVAVVPGVHFGSQGEGHFRVAYATSESRIQEGLERIEEFCRKLVE